MALKLESASNQVLQLRSTNESLRADLSFDHSELLFLKLQLRALEADSASVTLEERPDKRAKVANDIEQWEASWRCAASKLSERRAKYGSVGTVQGLEVAKPGVCQDGTGADDTGQEALAHRSETVDRLRHHDTNEAGSTVSGSDDLSGVPCQRSATCLNGLGEEDGSEVEASSGLEPQSSRTMEPLPTASHTAGAMQSTNVARSSAWSQLWDELAGLAGIHDY
jgi:hypothetical protein